MKIKAYVFLLIILLVSFAFFYFNDGLIQEVAAIPIAGTLIGFVIQVVRDQASFERSQFLAKSQNSFLMGATSHMANVAFDKHVAFCEEYIEETRNTLTTLFREGATPNALEHAWNLYAIQQKHRVWLTPAIETELEKFEKALRTIGASAHLVRESPGHASQADIQEMHRTLAEVMGLGEWRGEELTNERAQYTLITQLRSVLGIEELTLMRIKIVKSSIAQIGINS